MFAVIETGGKQYRVEPGMKIQVERLALSVVEGLAPREDGKVLFDKVLLRGDGESAEIGAPYIAKASVEGTAKDIRGERKMVFRFHSKTRYRKKKTHRQPLSEVIITKISNT